MYVTLTDLDGHPIGQAELGRAPAGQLLLDGAPVITTRIIGSRTALILAGRQVCVATADMVEAQHPHTRSSGGS